MLFPSPEGRAEVSHCGKGQQSRRPGAELQRGQGQARERSWPTAGEYGAPGGGFMLNAALCKKGSQQIPSQEGQRQLAEEVSSAQDWNIQGFLCLDTYFSIQSTLLPRTVPTYLAALSSRLSPGRAPTPHRASVAKTLPAPWNLRQSPPRG